jgi:hypothetical protein
MVIDDEYGSREQFSDEVLKRCTLHELACSAGTKRYKDSVEQPVSTLSFHHLPPFSVSLDSPDELEFEYGSMASLINPHQLGDTIAEDFAPFELS